jgi:hypothetical protein
MVNTAFMYLAGTFHCLLGPVWPPTADQCVRPGAWSVGVPCGCLPRGRFAGQHPTGHAGTSMPCRPKSMSGAAMLWLSPPSRSQTHGLLMPKTGCPHRLGPRKVMGRVWRKTEVWGTTSNTSIIHVRCMAITDIIHP